MCMAGCDATRPPLENRPKVAGLYRLVQRDWGVRRADARVLEDGA